MKLIRLPFNAFSQLLFAHVLIKRLVESKRRENGVAQDKRDKYAQKYDGNDGCACLVK